MQSVSKTGGICVPVDHPVEGRIARTMVVFVALLVVLLGVVPSRAALLAPGASMLASPEPAPLGAAIDVLISPFATAFYSGTVTTTVIAGDATNPLGELTFTYVVAVDPSSPGGIERVNGIDYTGFLTDVSFVPGTGTSFPPTTQDRGFTGAQVGFNFVAPPLGLGVLLPGTISPTLVVQTSAPAYVPGIVNIIDGAVTAVPSFAPAIPEPMSLGILSLALVGALRRRRA